MIPVQFEPIQKNQSKKNDHCHQMKVEPQTMSLVQVQCNNIYTSLRVNNHASINNRDPTKQYKAAEFFITTTLFQSNNTRKTRLLRRKSNNFKFVEMATE